ncbi:putative kinetochore protein spc24 [Dispira parvispora]|uniref:Kinetochore protein Spc24 n=1 Tax=Dispira parvispora TaxID=1520584 RepID=A0A9W8E0I6_9FUNG|nr:putative kinetochore protein spc24 [Dispira parvispora]
MAEAAIEETRSIVQQTMLTLQPSSDVDIVRTINRDFQEATTHWEAQLDKDQELLRALSRKVDLAKADASRSKVGDDGLTHSERLVQLDREKYSMAKHINERETSVNSLNATVERLKEKLAQLEARDVEKELPPDSTVLKLHIYRSLGIEFVEDATGQINKALVRSASTNDVSAVLVNGSESDYYYANRLWELST